MYLRWRSIPELADLPQDEQKRLWKEAKRDPFNAGDLARAAFLLGMYIALGLILFCVQPIKSFWIGLSVFTGALVFCGFIQDAVVIQRYRPIVRRLRNCEG